MENEALKADVKRAGEVADENQAKIAQLYADLVAEQKGHAETQVTAEAAKLAASEAASDAAEKLAEERRQISLLKSEAVLQVCGSGSQGYYYTWKMLCIRTWQLNLPWRCRRPSTSQSSWPRCRRQSWRRRS